MATNLVRMETKHTVRALIAACHYKACAPPPVGEGGSVGNSAPPKWGGVPFKSLRDDLISGASAKAAAQAKRDTSYAGQLAKKIVGRAEADEGELALRRSSTGAPSTRAVMAAAKAAGADLIGVEYRVKGEARTAEKIESKARKMAKDEGVDLPPGESKELRHYEERYVREFLDDSLRFTVRVSHDNYPQEATKVLDELKAKGFKVIEADSVWKDPSQIDPSKPQTIYQGTNTVVQDANGRRIEVQFHTAESFHTKDVVMHKDYEIARSDDSTPMERQAANERMAAASRLISVPPGAVGWTYTEEPRTATPLENVT